jgi:protein TonB
MNHYADNKNNWEEIVFENRNKSYGAYVLREEYDRTVLKSYLIVLASLLFISGVAIGIARLSPKEIKQIIDDGAIIFDPPLRDIVVPEEIKPPLLPAGGNNATNSPPVIVETPIDTTVEDTFSTPSPTTNSGNDTPYHDPNTGTGNNPNTDDNDKETPGTSAYNAHFNTGSDARISGGIQAMHRFIQDNLKVQEGADVERTRIVVSFVVGPDGNISDIRAVSRKTAGAWKKV